MTVQRHVAVMACVLAATALFTAFCHDQFLLSLAFTGLIFAVLGHSGNWIRGNDGQVSFGHALFFEPERTRPRCSQPITARRGSR